MYMYTCSTILLIHIFSFFQRPFVEPVSFLKASRPPWFEPGFQQDCSEFLRYLLDQLHEQEKTVDQVRTRTVHQQSHPYLYYYIAYPIIAENVQGILLSSWFLCTCRSEKPKSSGSKSSKVSQNSFDSELTSGSTSDLQTLVSRTFGGQLLNVYKCLKCKHESTRVESFNDLALAFVDGEKQKKSAKKTAQKSNTQQQKLQTECSTYARSLPTARNSDGR